MTSIKQLIKKNIFLLDPILAVLGLIGYMGVLAKRAATSSPIKLNLTNWVFRKLNYLPILNHYYEPLTFDAIGSKYRSGVAKLVFDETRNFDFLRSIARPDEFKSEYIDGEINKIGFHFNNGSFESGDAEVLFYYLRSNKPSKIIEIGAGNSSLLISAALKLNSKEGANGEHVIVEPYENPWLEKLDAKVIRQRVEEVNFSTFIGLSAGDLVFIDSSHVVRAQNDCVFEYTELLPSLPAGVVVHVHDIFSPFDYPDEWLNKRYYLWAEQYILEAVLANSREWEVLAPLHWLSQDTDQFKALCPYFEAGHMPGSMWIRKL